MKAFFSNIKKGFKLMKYGLGFKSNMIICIIFIILGIVMEIVSFLPEDAFVSGIQSCMGAVFLFCAAMFPAQLVYSLDVVSMPQVSSHKRTFQIDIPLSISLFCTVIAMLVDLLVRSIYYFTNANADTTVFYNYIAVGVLGASMVTLFSLMYKYFIASLLLIYVFIFSIMYGLTNYIKIPGVYNLMQFFKTAPAVTDIVFTFVLVIVGAIIGRTLAIITYKKPIDKKAFGAALKRSLQ